MRARYGASPLHLIANLGVIGLTVYAVTEIFVLDAAVRVLVWLAAAVLLHDAILWPLYSGANQAGERLLGRAVNYVRVPLGLSLVLALAFAGTLSGKGGPSYTRASGQAWDGYVVRWLVVSGVLFVVSGVVFAVRRR